MFVLAITNEYVVLMKFNTEMAVFFDKLEKSLLKKTAEADNARGCTEWVGCRDKYGYGTKRVTWPDHSVTLERVHRVVFMVHNKLLRDDVPRYDSRGILEVSHLCHNKICIKPQHLVLESHEQNCERKRCECLGYCTLEHVPPCIFFRWYVGLV